MVKKPTAADRLAEALAAAEAVKLDLARLIEARNKALLADQDKEALRLDGEIDIAERTAKACGDKVELLRAAAAREAHERRAHERSKLIERIEARLAKRDALGAELGETIRKADALFREMLKVAVEVRAAWPWQHYELPPTLLGDVAITQAVEHEIYRHGARPLLGGGLDKPGAGLHFPGGKPPTLQLIGDPGRITPLADVLKDASRMAAEVMKTGKASGVVPVTAVPIPPEAGGAPSEKSAAELHLAALLAKQNTLADDVTPRGDELYAEVLAQIIEVQDEIDRFRSLANGGSR